MGRNSGAPEGILLSGILTLFVMHTVTLSDFAILFWPFGFIAHKTKLFGYPIFRF
jgi:hypothetical protein